MGDVPFLTESFQGADGVYLMLPPMWDSDDQKKQSVRYARNFSNAIRATGVKNVVFLSSYGAHRLDDAGAISGCGLAEGVLNKLDGVKCSHPLAPDTSIQTFCCLSTSSRQPDIWAICS